MKGPGSYESSDWLVEPCWDPASEPLMEESSCSSLVSLGGIELINEDIEKADVRREVRNWGTMILVEPSGSRI